MGNYFTDKFSFLHFATGIIVYYWNMSFIEWFIIHIIFEIVENTKYGMMVINKTNMWPGGKKAADNIINMIGDQYYALLGWISAYLVCTVIF